jgi:hypothetical protein
MITTITQQKPKRSIRLELALSTAKPRKADVDDHITDCTLTGLDPFFNDGAALGVLFEEKRTACGDYFARTNASNECRKRPQNDRQYSGLFHSKAMHRSSSSAVFLRP